MDDLLALLKHRKLIFTYRYMGCTKGSNIGSLTDRIAEKAYRDAGFKITHLNLRFNGRITLYTCYSNQIHIIKGKFCQLRDHGLDKNIGFFRIKPAAQKKKIAVLGGGPAGLEAARVAALRGHDVTLFEKTTTLGGQLNIACVPPRKEEMRRATQDLIHAVCNAGVHLCMGQTRTAEQLKDAGFEAVINAVGAHSAAPRIPGIDSVNVADAWKVLAGEQQVYGTVAVIGGGMVGCETAEYLAARGCKVSVIEMMDKIAAGESTTILPTLLENYKTYGVEQYPSHKVKEFRMDAVVCENKDGAEVTIPCDHIVLAMGARSNEFDAAALEAANIPVYSIGDAAGKAADISNAIRTGYDTACQL